MFVILITKILDAICSDCHADSRSAPISMGPSSNLTIKMFWIQIRILIQSKTPNSGRDWGAQVDLIPPISALRSKAAKCNSEKKHLGSIQSAPVAENHALHRYKWFGILSTRIRIDFVTHKFSVLSKVERKDLESLGWFEDDFSE